MAYVIKIVNSKKEMKDFLKVPHIVYKNDSAWISPLHSEIVRTLDPEKNPYFRNVDIQKYVCYCNDKPVSRAISVINYRNWQKKDKRNAFFGYFESINDQESVNLLFETIAGHCRQMDCDFIEGPFNPNHYSELGLLVKNFSEPVFFETYNPEYYSTLLKNAGFEPIYRLHTRVNKDAMEFMDKKPVFDLTNIKDNGYIIRSFDLLHIKRDLEFIREVFNDAFSENWHFLSLTNEEYSFSAKSLFLVSRPDLIKIVEHHGSPVGVMQCMPNINPLLKNMRGSPFPWHLISFLWRRRLVKELVLFAVGIKKSYQKGVVSFMLSESMRKILKTYPVLYTTWMTEDNITAIKASEFFGLVPYKWFDIFSKNISPVAQ
jgi:hypothetical protein